MKNGPHPTDKHVGSRIRMRRLVLDKSQTDLAEALGVTFQQVQKYEKGTNRVSASRLEQTSQFLQVPVAFFFDGLSNPEGKTSDGANGSYVADFLAISGGLNLTKAFVSIKNPKLRTCIVRFVEELARAGN